MVTMKSTGTVIMSPGCPVELPTLPEGERLRSTLLRAVEGPL